jgi:2-polyprenyl-6-methoxyphenol hydroxylase-like FAD-dependent oxidoreductase
VRFVTAPDLDDKLDALREITRRHVPQTLPMIWAFADAAAGDPEIAQAWAEYEQRRRTDVRALVGAREPWLRSDLDVERATDIYWAFFSDVPARSLIRGLGWTVDQIADLLTDALRRLLLQ